MYIELRPSRQLQLILALSHAGGIVALYPAILPVWIKLGLAIAVALSCRRLCLGVVSLARPESITAIRWNGSKEWRLFRKDNKEETAQLGPSSYVHPLLVILELSIHGGKGVRRVVILPDMLDRQVFRRLRVALGVAGDSLSQDR
ncbi:MAG: hypothetical protein GY731_04690 [Gammaproteobacteria bacterium]|nr:hypothetical protein [Gammaproteobacteria bacterium]